MQEYLYFTFENITGSIPFQTVVKTIRMVAISNATDSNKSETICYHGKDLPIYSINELFGLSPKNPKPEDSIIIINSMKGEVGLWVEKICLFKPELSIIDLTSLETIQKTVTEKEGINYIDDVVVISNIDTLILSFDKKHPQIISDSLNRSNEIKPVFFNDELESRAEKLAKLPVIPEPIKELSLLFFSLSHSIFAVDMQYIKEVIHVGEITPVPGTPSYIIGICPIRGEIISLIDIRILMKFPDGGLTNFNQVIIVHNEKLTLGILVDTITNIKNIPMDKIDESIENRSLHHINDGDSIIHYIDIGTFLADPTLIIDESDTSYY